MLDSGPHRQKGPNDCGSEILTLNDTACASQLGLLGAATAWQPQRRVAKRGSCGMSGKPRGYGGVEEVRSTSGKLQAKSGGMQQRLT